jgi:hypothetical protein
MKEAPHLTDRHLLVFGTIVHWFARYEQLMEEIIAAVAGSDSASIMLLTRGLDFSGKRRALFDLLRHRKIPLDQYDAIERYLIIPHTLTPLRNDIIHSVWVPGSTSHLIQPDWILRLPPSVRPLHGEVFIELEEDRVAYSLDDLSDEVRRLAENYELFSEYLRKIGLIPANKPWLLNSSPREPVCPVNFVPLT